MKQFQRKIKKGRRKFRSSATLSQNNPSNTHDNQSAILSTNEKLFSFRPRFSEQAGSSKLKLYKVSGAEIITSNSNAVGKNSSMSVNSNTSTKRKVTQLLPFGSAYTNPVISTLKFGASASEPPLFQFGAFTAAKGVERLVHDMKDWLLSEQDCDVTLKVKETQFRAHKFFLKARSPVFRAMFENEMVEKGSNSVNIVDCEPDGFKDFLFYLYTGSVDISGHNVLDLYYMADKYIIEELTTACKEFMLLNFSVDNFCDFLNLALLHNESSLIESANRFFETNMKIVIKTPRWQLFVKENPVTANELLIKTSG